MKVEHDIIISMGDFKILGMMSGTSGDGIDGALVEFNDDGNFKLLWSDSWNYSDEIFDRIKLLMNRPTAEEILYGQDYIAKLYAKAAKNFLERNDEKPDFIAAHGQTIIHRPKPQMWDGIAVNGSMQLLNGSRLSEELKLPVICNFRERDIVAGGQGAPLVPFGDFLFFRQHVKKSMIVLNVGGIANLTCLIREHDGVKVKTAYDTGPGNMLMDAYVQLVTNSLEKYDRGGAIAAEGKSIKSIVDSYLTLPYFCQKFPKSTGRTQFGSAALEKILKQFSPDEKKENILSTIMDITVESVAREVENISSDLCKPDQLLVAGGGALNTEFMFRLGERVKHICIVGKTDEFGIPVMSREAMSFAALGYAYIKNISANVTTGANKKVVLGVKY